VFWWFERGGEFIRVEILQLASDRFELRLIRADGTETVETFSNAVDLGTRQDEVQRDVRQQGWSGPHGWVM
jgi:hypothetical protein